MRPLTLSLVAMLATLAATPPIDPAGRRIVGEWRGTSLCTNRELAPACKDETVRYVFTGPIGGTNTYHLVADKLVGQDLPADGRDGLHLRRRRLDLDEHVRFPQLQAVPVVVPAARVGPGRRPHLGGGGYAPEGAGAAAPAGMS